MPPVDSPLAPALGRRAETLERVLASGVVLIVRLRSSDGLDGIAEAAVRGGVGALEVTMNTPGALDWLRGARTRFGDRLALGVGTVLDVPQARKAIEAGAEFYVSPVLDTDVLGVARESGLVTIPGAFTPTEILASWQAGADLVKVFPANVGGPRYLADVLAPLNDIPLFPTGGIDESNAGAFVRAGASAIAVGASIVNEETVGGRRFDEIAERCARVVQTVATARRPAGD